MHGVRFANALGATVNYFRITVPAYNYTTRNRDLLEKNDFLANPENRVVVTRTAAPGTKVSAPRA